MTAAGSPATAVLAGSETGVRLADKLADALRLPGNGGDSSDKRRDKHSQQEAVRAAGARAIKQALCTSLEDVSAFLDTFGDAPVDVILKPTESAGSDGSDAWRRRGRLLHVRARATECGCGVRSSGWRTSGRLPAQTGGDVLVVGAGGAQAAPAERKARKPPQKAVPPVR